MAQSGTVFNVIADIPMTYLNKIVLSLFGKRNAYRLGRALYMYGRGDIPNNINVNGEALVQKCIIDAWNSNSNANHSRLVVFDVGANVGDWSTALLKQLPSRLVRDLNLYCFEPVPDTYATLRANLSGYSEQIFLEELAFSSKTGSAEITVSNEANCGTNSLHKIPFASGEKYLNINVTTAHDYCEKKGVNHVHLMKCDTEGHDCEVIRGALPLLYDNRVSVLQFEYNHRWILSRNFLRDIFGIIDGLPYMVAKLQPDHLLIFSCWHHELEKFYEGNYALVHESVIDWFPMRFARFDKSNIITSSQATSAC